MQDPKQDLKGGFISIEYKISRRLAYDQGSCFQATHRSLFCPLIELGILWPGNT